MKAPTMGNRIERLNHGNVAGTIPLEMSNAGSKGALTANSSTGQVFHRNSITGFCRIGIIGFGITCVIGCTRVPLPAARIMAFIDVPSLKT